MSYIRCAIIILLFIQSGSAFASTLESKVNGSVLDLSQSADKESSNSVSLSVQQRKYIEGDFDVMLLAPGFRIGYRISDMFGIEGGFNYISTTMDPMNMPINKLYVKSVTEKELFRNNYKQSSNMFGHISLDIYPLHDALSNARMFFGVGYLDKILVTKAKNANKEKLAGIVGIGYRGALNKKESLGLNLAFGARYIDTSMVVVDSSFKSSSNYELSPFINLSFYYAF